MAGGCGDGGPGACDQQPDVTGAWTFTLSPLDADAGVTLPREDTLHANLEQVKPPGVFSLGRLIYGSITSDDPGFFGTLSIPRLTMNNGSKTGSMLGCQLQINVPFSADVTDDNTDQGPLRLSLGGRIESPGMITGDPALSSLILDGDAAMLPRSFSWTGVKR